VGEHLSLTIDLFKGEFRAPKKLHALSKHVSTLLGHEASNARWRLARQLASVVGKAQILFLAIAPTRFFLSKLNSVLLTRQGCGSRVRITHQLMKRDLECWSTVPDKHNGSSIYNPIETTYLQEDFNGYG
jgi:hypothetical protein